MLLNYQFPFTYRLFILLLIIILVVSRNMLEESEYQCLARHVSILFV